MGLILLAVIGRSGLSFGSFLRKQGLKSGYESSLKGWLGSLYNSPARKEVLSPKSRKVYLSLIPIAKAELWVREATGNNDGFRVWEYQAAVGLKQGDPYCAAFVSWVFKQAGYASPRTGWSPALFPMAKLVKAAAPGNVFGIYFPSLKRIAHCGFVESVKNDWIGTIEANTSIAGSREGDGVYRRMRHKRSVYRYAKWQSK